MAPYLAYKAEQGDIFKDPWQTTFLQIRCSCLVVPKVEQCACEIHTQQNQYLDALAHLWGIIHAACSCQCAWCMEGCGKWSEMTRNMGKFSDFLACPKVNLFQDDPDSGEFMERTRQARRCPRLHCSEGICIVAGWVDQVPGPDAGGRQYNKKTAASCRWDSCGVMGGIPAIHEKVSRTPFHRQMAEETAYLVYGEFQARLSAD